MKTTTTNEITALFDRLTERAAFFMARTNYLHTRELMLAPKSPYAGTRAARTARVKAADLALYHHTIGAGWTEDELFTWCDKDGDNYAYDTLIMGDLSGGMCITKW